MMLILERQRCHSLIVESLLGGGGGCLGVLVWWRSSGPNGQGSLGHDQVGRATLLALEQESKRSAI